jgi:hypothetical protein
MSEIRFSLVKVTPEIANFWLAASHPENRPVKQERIRWIAWDIENGRWKLNNHLIAFDENGLLVDGQHRLHAILQAGIAVEIGVMRGLKWHD